MANLSYNTNIFTDVHKYDLNNNYRGILVTGKFNQKNGQDFKILDAIDIDWNGSFIKALNTYLYTTEDLINAFNLVGDSTTNITNYLNDNFVTFSYLSNNHYNKLEIDNKFDNKSQEIIDRILGPVDQQYDTLFKISEWIIDKSRYIKTDYINIVDPDTGHLISDKNYYIYLGNNQYEKVSEEYIINNPNEDYYEFVFNDIIDLTAELAELKNKVGDKIYNEDIQQYTYTGLYSQINNIHKNITSIENIIDDIEGNVNITYDLAYDSYYLAYNAYNTSYDNKEKIGTPTKYNIYQKIENWSDQLINQIKTNETSLYVYNENENTYTRLAYDKNYNGDYYLFVRQVNGTGIIKDIEDLNKITSENKKLLFNLSIENDNPAYLNLYLTPDDYEGNSFRIIKGGINASYFNNNTGEITNGVITSIELLKSFSYLFKWNILT